MKKWLNIAVLAGTFLVSSQQPSQAEPLNLSGFVCNVTLFSPEQNSGGGKFGFLSGRLFTEPFCQGGFISFFSLYSIGQTLDPTNRAFTQAQLMRIFQILQSQMIAGLRVNMFSIDTPVDEGFRGMSSVGVQHN